MIIFAVIALLTWIPISAMLFLLLPAQRAVVTAAVAGWLLLPPTGILLPGFPNYTKTTAVSLGIFVGTLLFEFQRVLSFRLRWFDLPMLLWCLCPFASSITNDLGVYDGLAGLFGHMTVWMFPYLIGRLYLTDSAALRELALGLVISGTCLIPFCLFENIMSPQLAQRIYGAGSWGGTRWGGYRPIVFFRTGLELGLWMNVVTLLAWWLWRTGQLKRLWHWSGGTVFAALLITTILARSTGATLLLLAGAGVLWFCCRTKTKWAMWCILLVAPIYYSVRIPNLWSGEDAIALIKASIISERSDSLKVRLVNENAFAAHALKRPAFGWGTWGRNLVYENGNMLLIDSLWIITFGSYGFLGLTLMTTALILPVALFLVRFPVVQWRWPNLAHVTVIALIVNLYLLDCLLNAMLNVIYVIAAGGLANIVTSHPRRTDKAVSAGANREILAARYRAAGRAAKDQGRLAEAKTAWLHALDLLTRLATAQPSVQRPVIDEQWCACANDLAWLLANAPDPSVRDVNHALALATKAAETQPGCSVYWNTLGVAHYRAGDFKAAVAALDRTITVGDGGTVFDHVFLAMAHAQLGNQDESRRWLALAMFKKERDYPGHPELTSFCNEAHSVIAAGTDAPAVSLPT